MEQYDPPHEEKNKQLHFKKGIWVHLYTLASHVIFLHYKARQSCFKGAATGEISVVKETPIINGKLITPPGTKEISITLYNLSCKDCHQENATSTHEK